MNSEKISTERIRSSAIQNVLANARYETDELLPIEKEYLERNKSPIRNARKDLYPGTFVVVLEGTYMGRRGIYVKRCDDFNAVIFIFTKNGNPTLFRIDERYLFKLTTEVKLPTNLEIDTDSLYFSSIDKKEEMVDMEGSELENNIYKNIIDVIGKVPYLKTYLMSDFEIDRSVEFYSQKY